MSLNIIASLYKFPTFFYMYYYGELPYKPLACFEHVGHVIYMGVLNLATAYAQTLRVIVASVQLINALKIITGQSVEPREAIMENALKKTTTIIRQNWMQMPDHSLSLIKRYPELVGISMKIQVQKLTLG